MVQKLALDCYHYDANLPPSLIRLLAMSAASVVEPELSSRRHTPPMYTPPSTTHSAHSPPQKVVVELGANLAGRDFIVGDVHGHFELLERLLKRVHFNPSSDRVLCTGDLIDRGPHSNEVVDWLARPWFHSVRGNHEQMIIDHARGSGDAPRHERNGGGWFYKLASDAQAEIYHAVKEMPLALQVSTAQGRTIGIIHAEAPGWDAQMTWSEALDLLASPNAAEHARALHQALYARSRISGEVSDPVRGIDSLYVGHSTVPKVTRLGNVTYLDTGCSFADGHLSAMELQSQHIHEIWL